MTDELHGDDPDERLPRTLPGNDEVPDPGPENPDDDDEE